MASIGKLSCSDELFISGMNPGYIELGVSTKYSQYVLAIASSVKCPVNLKSESLFAYVVWLGNCASVKYSTGATTASYISLKSPVEVPLLYDVLIL